MTMDTKEVLHMKEGTGETSYAKNSYLQKQVLLMTKSIKEEAIKDFYYKQLPKNLCMADLGCSTAELNNMSMIFELIMAVQEARRKLGLLQDPLDYQLCLNDLPSNDFNTVFKSLPRFQEKLKEQLGFNKGFGHCFVNAVPGSFYDRLFPTNSMHFFHSSYSLHWLSQVPVGINDNKGNIGIASTSPPCVNKAYYQQFAKDFSMFLQCRSKEMVPGGCMVLTLLGRNCNQPYSKKSYYAYDLLATVLNDMVSEGLVAEETLNSFNFPLYFASGAEIKTLVEREGSFNLKEVHVYEINWEGDHNDGFLNAYSHYDFARCMRSVTEPLIASHFGEEVIIDEVFKRYIDIVNESKTKKDHVFTNVTVLMTRKE